MNKSHLVDFVADELRTSKLQASLLVETVLNGIKKGLRGRFGMYVPPLMEALGLAEVEHNARGNRMRAI